MVTALWPGLHRGQHRDFAVRTTAPFPGLSLSPDIGVMEFYHTPECVPGIPILHGFADLMAPAPGRGIGNAQIILELTGRGARGSGGHQKDGPELLPQGFACLVKDGMGGNGGLMIAALALILSPRGDQIGLIMVTAGTAEATGPFARDEIPEAVTLGAKPPCELPGCHRRIHSLPPLYKC